MGAESPKSPVPSSARSKRRPKKPVGSPKHRGQRKAKQNGDSDFRVATHANATVYQGYNRKKLKSTTSEMDLRPMEDVIANPESVREGKKRCIHMENMAKDVSLPGMTLNQTEYYIGRMPAWYVEDKFLKRPGDYVVYRSDSNRLYLAVMTNEKDNPTAHIQIEFTSPHLEKPDQKCHYRFVGTVLQQNTVQGLIQKYSDNKLVQQNLKRDAELINGVLPCQSCVYDKQEYNYHYVYIKDQSEIKLGEPITSSPGANYKLYKAIRTETIPTQPPKIVEHNVIAKEYTTQNEETLNTIFHEMNIVKSIRFEIGIDTALNVDCVMSVHRPFYICFDVASEGSLKEFLKAKKDTLTPIDRVKILKDVASSLFQIYAYKFLYCDIRVKNVMVDNKPLKLRAHATETFVPSEYRYYLNNWQYSSMNETKKLKILPPAPMMRYLAPEVLKSMLLNEASEVYAFGLLIFEVLSETVPFKDMSDTDLSFAKWNGKIMVTPEFPKEITPVMRELIQQCTAEKPEDRPEMIKVFRKLREIINKNKI